MLTITIPKGESFDAEKNEFVYYREQVLKLEHSLVSISKWEALYLKPFLSKEEKTIAETIDYIKCMTITQNVKSDIYNGLSNENINEVNKYIESKATATILPKEKNTGKRTTTSELIYYWMVALNIPFECQKWHLNRLLTLIQVCNIEGGDKSGKKMSKGELRHRNRTLNEARKKALNTKG